MGLEFQPYTDLHRQEGSVKRAEGQVWAGDEISDGLVYNASTLELTVASTPGL